ncbi:hypothetical protein AAF712_016246 [Marasmius tenuissimus]|uniref:Uncharacterized protein n=1 Tax=Marasmius tenuissimus TaxID=585030 RepID=A0ABR2Z774_9AGAR
MASGEDNELVEFEVSGEGRDYWSYAKAQVHNMWEHTLICGTNIFKLRIRTRVGSASSLSWLMDISGIRLGDLQKLTTTRTARATSGKFHP